MYRCKECGNLFEEGEQKRWVEPHGEELSGCPVCSGVYECARPCKICGTYSSENIEYCNDCKELVKKRFKDFMDNEFSKEERELLNEIYDGERL